MATTTGFWAAGIQDPSELQRCGLGASNRILNWLQSGLEIWKEALAAGAVLHFLIPFLGETWQWNGDAFVLSHEQKKRNLMRGGKWWQGNLKYVILKYNYLENDRRWIHQKGGNHLRNHLVSFQKREMLTTWRRKTLFDLIFTASAIPGKKERLEKEGKPHNRMWRNNIPSFSCS